MRRYYSKQGLALISLFAATCVPQFDAIAANSEPEWSLEGEGGIDLLGGSDDGSAFHESAAGAWETYQGGEGKSCGVLFTSRSGDQDTLLGYFLPIPKEPTALLLLSGPKVPVPEAMERKKFTLISKDSPPQAVTAFNVPRKGRGMIVFYLPDVQAAMKVMTDVDTIEVQLQGKSIFSLSYDAGFKARDKMLECMSDSK